MSQNIGDFGEDDLEKQPNESIVEFYLRTRKDEIKENTADTFRVSWNRLRDYIDSEHPDKTIFDLTTADVKDWYAFLESDGVRSITIKHYASNVAQIMNDLRANNYIQGNKTPFVDAQNIVEFNTRSGSKLEVAYLDMREAINNIISPTALVLITLLAKYGLRSGELLNLDERDLNLNHPISTYIDDPRRQIRNNPNSMYIDSTISEGKIHNGERRRISNKKKSTRELPLDDETVELLAWYLSMRASSNSPSNPVITSNKGGGDHRRDSEYDSGHIVRVGSRPGMPTLTRAVERFAKQNDWHDQERRAGIHPHWFRHWFTTIMRGRVSEDEIHIGTVKGFVGGLRGDTGGEVIDTYTQDWNEAFEEDVPPYDKIVRRNLPKFFD
ncbi:tyrosine-type recombinase/integrase [Halonotius pteroides]|uniref:Core-binding (CB) domain-containing protein n=1 Tax=Halonotius pteroides TaxID=268735 RepID=A0A3A6Q477_9EURY|nr:site-specific integrase [Halonotius pteroides]RJX47819.1 hypothetical protein DP106_13985 [Halonotius pteroides]